MSLWQTMGLAGSLELYDTILPTGTKFPFNDCPYTDCQYSSMSLTDSNDNLSIAPLSVLTTVPVGPGALGRTPLGPFVAGRPPTRNGSLSIERARPSTKDVHPATTRIVAAQPTAALSDATARFRAWLFITTSSRPGAFPAPKGSF